MPLSSYLNSHPVLRGDVNRIVIGHSTNIQDLAMGHVSHKSETKPNGSPLIIGNYVTVGHAVILYGCKIGDECLIGMGSIVMDDVVIENRSLSALAALFLQERYWKAGFFMWVAQPSRYAHCAKMKLRF